MASLKLLVVDDDEPNLKLMLEILTKLEATVYAISDGLQAAELITRERFHGVFLDLEMPNLGGLALARLVRTSSWNKTTPIIIITGRDERETMSEAFAAGATFFLQKPVDRYKLGTLFRTVRGAMVENRRRFLRAPLRTEVSIRGRYQLVRGLTQDVSMGGIQVEGSGLTHNESVEVSFRLPQSSSLVEASGIIVWSQPPRFGIQFTKLSPEHRSAIRDFLSEYEPD